MHQITVSDAVMRNLRALCLIDGQSEDYVLRRILGCPQNGVQDNKEDFLDTTYGICFAKGFMIFRTYKGKSYTARVSNGCWVLDGRLTTNGTFDSLNKLSQSLIDGNENAWNFWYYLSPDGETRCISELRDPNLVQRRRHRKRPRKSTIDPIRGKATRTSELSSSVAHQSVQTKPVPWPLPADCSPITTNLTTGRKPWECE